MATISLSHPSILIDSPQLTDSSTGQKDAAKTRMAITEKPVGEYNSAEARMTLIK
jgi:hypothetical protein